MAQLAEIEDRINKCNKILGENPNSQIFAALAEAFRKKGDIDKAFRVCQSGLKIHPEYGSAHFVMAKINLDKGMYDWAELEVRKAMELDGNSHAADVLLSEIHIYKGELKKAAQLLENLLSQDANNKHIIKLLELAKKIPRQAEQSYVPEEPEARGEETVVEHAPVRMAVSEPEPAPIEKKASGAIDMLQLLRAISKLPSVEGALLINNEGLVAEQSWTGSNPPEEYGAFAREIEKNIQNIVSEAGFGNYENILIEAEDLVVSFRPLKGNLLLIKARGKVNLGGLRLKLSGLLDRLTDEYS